MMTRFLMAVATLAALPACVPTTPSHLVAPADPIQPVRALRYATVGAGIRSYRPVDPKDWRELNRSVGPQAGQGDPGGR